MATTGKAGNLKRIAEAFSAAGEAHTTHISGNWNTATYDTITVRYTITAEGPDGLTVAIGSAQNTVKLDASLTPDGIVARLAPRLQAAYATAYQERRDEITAAAQRAAVAGRR